MVDTKVKSNINDVAPPTTGKPVLHLFGPAGSNYAKLITAEALMQAREMIHTRAVVKGSVEAYNQTVDKAERYTIPRPDDVLRNQTMVQKAILENKQKKELLLELKSMGIDADPKEKLENLLKLKNDMVSRPVNTPKLDR